MATLCTAHNRGYGERIEGGGGVEPDLSLAVTPLCRCRFGQTSESAIGHERKPTQRP